MNIHKMKLLIYIQMNLFKFYLHYKNYITHNYSLNAHKFYMQLMLS
jgi:hypothetical protein